MSSKAWSLALLATASLSGGCSHAMANLKQRAANDLNCPSSSLRTRSVGGAWAVSGCGKNATYVLVGQPRQWVMNSVREDASDSRHARMATTSRQPSQSRVDRTRHAEGYALLVAKTFGTTGQLTFRIVGAPTRDAEHVLFGVGRTTTAPNLKGCELKVVVNGRLLALPEVVHNAEHHKEELRIKLPLTMLNELARAERVVGEACEQRFEFSADDFAMVREFLMRFQEELALSGSSAAPTEATPVGDGVL